VSPNPRWWTDERKDELRRLHATGATHSAIAAEMGTTRNAISGAVDRMGLKRDLEKIGIPYAERKRRNQHHYMARKRAEKAKQAASPKPALIRPAKQQEAPVTPVGPLSINPVTIIERKWTQCCFPLDRTNEDGEALFCGDPLWSGSYCKHHHACAHETRPSSGHPFVLFIEKRRKAA
jgi:hypothetical protein